MSEQMKTNRWIYIRWFIIRFILLVFDILAVNAAHFLALVIRFYVAKEFHSAAMPYLEAYGEYALWYTVFCLAVFFCCKLYSGIWKFAGFNDLTRIMLASAICFVAHVAGTLLFVMRMPITFYCIGAFLQFCLIAASRFSYRLILMEKTRVSGKKDAVNHAMVIGTGSIAQNVRRELEREKDIRLMCILNYKNTKVGSLLDGVPVVDGIDNLKSAVEKHQINYVIIASASMSREVRDRIKDICAELDVEAQDYSGFFQSTGSYVTFRNLMECTKGPVELMIHDKHLKYPDGKQALRHVVGRYMVQCVWAEEDVLMVKLGDYSVVQNDLNADWVRNMEKETGEEISFF